MVFCLLFLIYITIYQFINHCNFSLITSYNSRSDKGRYGWLCENFFYIFFHISTKLDNAMIFINIQSNKMDTKKRLYRELEDITKLKISQALKGRSKSTSHKENISQGLKNYWKTVPKRENE